MHLENQTHGEAMIQALRSYFTSKKAKIMSTLVNKMSIFDGCSSSDIEQLMITSHPEITSPVRETLFPSTQHLYEQLTDAEITEVENKVLAQFGELEHQQLRNWRSVSFPHFRREILRYGATVCPGIFGARLKLFPHNPPASVHSMMRSTIFAGDVYSGDMVMHAVEAAGFNFQEGKNYLEFGCSSAPLLRNMYATQPKANWYGCDPVEDSIAWAKQNFPYLNLVRNDQTPPLDYQDDFFEGAFAISIWSHFSEAAALQWFDEMHRVLKKGGFLMFTNHGYRSLYYYLIKQLRDVKTVSNIYSEMLTTGYSFHPIFKILNIPDSDLLVDDWGDSYFTADWLIANMFPKWKLVHYTMGRNQDNQDVYVLQRN
jgi:SAM-dependent methyltransferase